MRDEVATRGKQADRRGLSGQVGRTRRFSEVACPSRTPRSPTPVMCGQYGTVGWSPGAHLQEGHSGRSQIRFLTMGDAVRTLLTADGDGTR